jgi:AAA family ATP:ADP antiporter
MTRMRSTSDPSSLGPGIVFSAALLMGYHVASRAARDTLFLTNIGLRWLPLMAATASVFSIAAALYVGARMAARGPRTLVPVAFLLSAALTLLEWWLHVSRPGIGSIVFFVHVAGFSPVLVSGFWSILGDSLDARTTRNAIGRISALATTGGLAGFLVAERITAWFGLPATMPVFAAANLWCAWSTARLTRPPTRRVPESPAAHVLPAGFQVLSRAPHLRNLALIVLGASVSAAMLDYIFKAHATGHSRQSLELMRVFLGFNGIVTIGTFVMQLSFSRLARARNRIVLSIGSLPATVLVGGVAACFLTSPWVVAVVRGSEAVLHGSLFRGGYELLYSALPKAQRNSVRTLIDVGFDRFGDILAAGTILFVLSYLPVASTTTLFLLSAAVGGLTLLAVLRLPHGHVAALEESLQVRAADVGPIASLSSLQFSMGVSGISGPEINPDGPAEPAPVVPPDIEPEPVRSSSERTGHEAQPVTAHESGSTTATLVATLGALRSEDDARARAALEQLSDLDPALVPQVIRLLGSAGVGTVAAKALMPVAELHVGQLVDALLDPHDEVQVRRGIPPILATCAGPRAVEGLAHGLMDHQFDVRSACAVALVRLKERDATLGVPPALAFEAVCWEARLGRQIWEALDPRPSRRAAAPLDEFLRVRAEASLAHIFTVLSLVLPRTAVMNALEGLKGTDASLRGTALEYLDDVLPPVVREALGPILEAAPSRQSPRP